MSVVDLITGSVTPMVSGAASRFLGIPEPTVRKILAMGVPVLLGALTKRATSPGGTEALSAALDRVPANPMETLGLALSGDPARAGAATTGGADLLSSLLGAGETNALASRLGAAAGVDAKAANPLLGLLGAATLGGLKNAADSRGMDPAALVRLLDSQKSEIAAAIPPEFAAAPAAPTAPAAAAPPKAAPKPAAPRPVEPRPAPPPPPERKSGAMRWILILLAVAVLAWLAMRFLGGEAEAPVADAPAPAEAPADTAAAPAPAPEPAPAATPAPAPAATPAPATEPAPAQEAANPLVIGGVDIGASIRGVIDDATGALAGVTDTATAEAARARLDAAGATLTGLETTASALPAEAKSSLAALVAAALPALEAAGAKAAENPTVGPTLKPAIDGLVARLRTLAEG